MTTDSNSIVDLHSQDFADSAVEQLRLLGYQQDELAYYRAIADNKPRKLKANFPDIPSELATLNNEEFNIYVVVNGCGDKDADVITCKAIFYEHDDRPKEDQLLLWQSFGLPEPTLQVDTGGKSIHSYWVFDVPITPDLWKTLQIDLINYTNADQNNKNLARVMRLAGFRHYKKGVTGGVASIVSKSETRYSYDELRAVIPPTPVLVKETKQKQQQDRKPSPPKAANSSGTAIPLENCLAHSNRDLLRGVSEGGRNDSGATLVRDLIGTANYLDSIGTIYIGDARSLFNDFCTRCSPSLDDAEAQTIWNSAESDFPEPSCPPDAIANILNAWYKEHDPKYVKPQEERKTGGDRLLEIAKTVTYFHTSDKVAYADVTIEGNRHTYAVRSKAFRLWLSREYLDRTEKGIGSQTLQDTLSTLEAIAIFRGETREVHLRTAEHQGKIYLDLGTDDWKAIEVDSCGWRLLSNPPVRFWRPDSLLRLPIPVTGGNLDELKDLLNVDGASWTLIITFLLFCFCPDKTYPVLVLSAHRGSGKTAAAEIIKGLIDPGKAALIKLQNDTHKLAVAATRRHLMVYDNVSHISPDQSDDLCRIATGFGFSTRTLHTTDEETTFELTRPQIITAIDALVTRDDLADRVLMAQLPEIPAEKRLPQGELNAKVEAARPRILGALLTALSQTLAQPRPNPETLPRMADYALFAIASEKALGLKKGEFMATFDKSREQSRQIVIESSPVGEAILSFMRERLVWKGTASNLLTALEKCTDGATYRSNYFPKASNSLSRQLTRLAPDLKALGIEVGYFREGQDRNRLICLEKVVKISSISSISSADDTKASQDKGLNTDDIMDDTRTISNITDDIADDITNTDDTRTISHSHIVHAESTPEQSF